MLAIAGLVPVARFLWLALAHRLTYPFALDWLEGASVLAAQRILGGQPLYVAPNLDFIPFIYTPLYFQVGAACSGVLGTGYVALRVISLLGALASGVLIFVLVRRSPRGTPVGGLVAVGFFFAAYRVTGAYLDVARVDSLFLALLLGGLVALRSDRLLVRSVLAAVLMFLAFFTKQTALVIAAPVAAWCLVARPGRERWIFPGMLLFLVVSSTLIMNAATDGWYGYYVFELSPRHTMGTWLQPGFWILDLARWAPVALVLAALVLVTDMRERPRRETSYEVLLFGSLIVASWMLRRHQGGYDNVLLPAYLGLAVMSGRAVDTFFDRGVAARAAVTLAVLAQLVILRYPLAPQIPTAAAGEEGRALLGRLTALEGDILVPSHPYYVQQAGHRSRASSMALWDVQRVDHPRPETLELERELEAMVRRRAFTAIILDRVGEYPAGTAVLDSHYVLADTAWTSADFEPVTGWGVRPRYFHVPRPLPDHATGIVPSADPGP